jgi:hypothetical protein
MYEEEVIARATLITPSKHDRIRSTMVSSKHTTSVFALNSGHFSEESLPRLAAIDRRDGGTKTASIDILHRQCVLI